MKKPAHLGCLTRSVKGRRLVSLSLMVSVSAVGAGAQPISRGEHDTTVVIVIRHAEKDSVPRGDPPLTQAGRARAAALIDALSSAHVQAIITTQLRRSRETAAPLAAALHIVPEIVPRGNSIEAHARAVSAAVRRHRGQTVLVVGHGETVGAIMSALGAPRQSDLCASDYSELFVLVLDESGARVTHESYGAPSATPADCANLY